MPTRIAGHRGGCHAPSTRGAAPLIIALLATIAIPSLLKSRQAAEKASAIGTLHTMHINQTGFYTQKGRYGTLPELNDYTGGTLGTSAGSSLLRGNYMYYSWPSDPSVARNQYQILAIRFQSSRITSAFLIDQNGRLYILIDE